MAGIVVHNYHYLSNVVAAELIRIFHLPLIATQFHYLVIFLSLLVGLCAIVFGQITHMKKSYIYWLVFFLYFSGDITYLLTFLMGKGFNFNTPFLENALWMWFSPPRVFATVVLFAGLSLFVLWIKKRNIFLGILMSFVLASLIGFKIYYGVFMAAGIAALAIYYLFVKQFRMLLPLVCCALLSLLLYLPVNANSGGFVFTGGWRFENFVMQPNLGLQQLEMAREIYAAHHNWFGVARFESFFFILYLIFVFGTISVGLLQTKKSLANFPIELNIFLFSGISVCAFLGFFFIQQAGGANSSQFLITIDIVASIYAALACYYWIGKLQGILKYVGIGLIVILTIPRVIDTEHVILANFSNHNLFFIDAYQLEALTYLKNNSPATSIILVDNFNREQKWRYDPYLKKRVAVFVEDPRSWIGNFSYYISFLADRSLFIDGNALTNSIVDSHGVSIQDRVATQKTILTNKTPLVTKALLQQNHINYLYLDPTSHLAKKPPSFLKPVLRNKEVCILQVL